MAGSNVVSPSRGTNLPRRGHQWLDPELRAAIEDAFVDAYRELRGKRPHAALRKRAPVLVAHLERCRHFDGRQVKRSIPQIASKIGPELEWVAPRTVRETHDRYQDVIHSTLNILAELGWIDGWRSCVKPSGQGEGILIYLSLQAPIAQPDRPIRNRPAPRRRGAQHSRPQVSERVPPPSGITTTTTTQGRASARGALGTRAAAEWLSKLRAALDAETAAAEREGVEILAAHPWIAEVDPLLVARAAAELVGRPDPRISLRQRRRFDAACRRLGHYGYCGLTGPAAAAAAAFDTASADWQQWYSKPPATLGGIAHCVRRTANTLRRQSRARKAAAC